MVTIAIGHTSRITGRISKEITALTSPVVILTTQDGNGNATTPAPDMATEGGNTP
jgi:hypothetical protein